MNIGSIQNGIGETATKVFESIKDATVWTGHQITKGFDKCVELVKSAWNVAFPFLKDAAVRTTDFLRTAPGMGLVLGASSFALGYAAHSKSGNKLASLGLQAASIVTAVGAGALTGYGYATGMHSPLV